MRVEKVEAEFSVCLPKCLHKTRKCVCGCQLKLIHILETLLTRRQTITFFFIITYIIYPYSLPSLSVSSYISPQSLIEKWFPVSYLLINFFCLFSSLLFQVRTSFLFTSFISLFNQGIPFFLYVFYSLNVALIKELLPWVNLGQTDRPTNIIKYIV